MSSNKVESPLREAFRVFLGDIPCYKDKFQEPNTSMLINIALITDGFLEDSLMQKRLDTLVRKTIEAHPTAKSTCAVRFHLQYTPDVCNLAADVHKYMRTNSVGFQSYHALNKTQPPSKVKKAMLENCQYAVLYITMPKLQLQIIKHCRKHNIKFHLG